MKVKRWAEVVEWIVNDKAWSVLMREGFSETYGRILKGNYWAAKADWIVLTLVHGKRCCSEKTYKYDDD